MVTAFVDFWDDQIVRGWAEVPGKDGPATLRVELEGRIIGSVLADQYRSDIGKNVGYAINLSMFPRSLTKKIAIRVEDSELVLRHEDAGAPVFSTSHSLFGGMWIDRVGWEDILAEKLDSGEISQGLAEQITDFERDGYVVLPGAVGNETLDSLNEDIEAVWAGRKPGLNMESFSVEPGQLQVLPADAQYRYGATKLLDPHAKLTTARAAASAPSVVRFLEAIFEDRARAFQQLCFTMGSQQPTHKDTAYVKIDGNPMSMAATWLALEDINQGTGELEYYIGSHRSPDYIFGEMSKWMEYSPAQHDNFLNSLHLDAKKYNLKHSKFLGHAGDILIWHADLAHGGSPITNPGLTRKSLVTHYTASSNRLFYMRSTNYNSLEANGVVFSSQYGDIVSK